MSIHKTPLANGVQWISCGWGLFKPWVGLWIIITIAVTALFILLSLLQSIGSVVASLISPLITAGMLNGAQKIHAGEALDASHILAPLQNPKRNALLVLGAAQVAVTWLGGLIAFSFLSPAVMDALHSGGGSVNQPLGGLPLLGALIAALIWALFLMAMFYAPALVWFDGVKPTDSLRESFRAAWQNMLPLSVFGAIMLGLGILAMIPAGLGFLILWPVGVCSVYCSYRDVFQPSSDSPSAILET